MDTVSRSDFADDLKFGLNQAADGRLIHVMPNKIKAWNEDPTIRFNVIEAAGKYALGAPSR
ncbi:hypothetical protein [Aureimonas sp. AU4]|uniref:hypothetical protein n=1 Tax=Aureimonas sp. AU4 TaxID=1638163 RepID=UPI000AD9ED36|nr:hypothetical protein [Aureimonas sp. AU4]